MSQPITEQDCIGPDAEYIKLIAADGKGFFVKRADAVEVSKTIRRILDGPSQCKEGDINQIELSNIASQTLKIVCDFLGYRARVNKLKEGEDADDFPIRPEDAVDVLKAANFLEC
ncbi:elongin-C-like [Cloeon dipterum]|uniref:elongin-C-like n=1 Tax=Cloeon dipterum TaxID=197152 RepID=UPI00322076A1